MFAITTPIYYVNDVPHLGHAYTTILADGLAGYHRLRGEAVFFQTGVDEHGQKVWNAVKKTGITSPENDQLQAYVDAMAARFKAAWDRLHIHYDDFIRTTEARHTRVVRQVLQSLWEAGQIYRGQYEGWYCVPDERFWMEKDIDSNSAAGVVCPDCKRPLERIVETNYFFRMSQHQAWLVDYIRQHPDFIQPGYRRNEVLGFLRRPLADLCISRPRSRLPWGIPLPFDADFVTYVWFDALLNYISAAGYGEDDQRFAAVWPNTLHLIGKDILTTHAVYWPTMLHAAGLPLPRQIFAHGWWVISGEKMSKSLGNTVKPLDLAEIYGVDAFRYFVLREMAPEQDTDFDPERVASRYHTDLANNLGNLVQRITTLVERSCGGRAPAPVEAALTPEEQILREQISTLPETVFAQADACAIHEALAAAMGGLTAVNGYLERSAPWTLAKQRQQARVATVLYSAGEALRLVSVLLSPVLPEKCAEIWRRLGWKAPSALSEGLNWGGWQPGSTVRVGAPLFPRIGA